ncbi:MULTISPECIES: LysR family transcriptional regulator [Burkholderia]|uniref:LysR family transcriptional regulator n=1 Tax=Burkholderia TaxID=32008 RepID=UPI0009BB2D45|nr:MULTISPECIES: LysR family transcriptional regulator [Burkholderia]MDN7501047.1 LysR family transcriptional regulator [Burkholderia gladioli]MDN7604952.1 LysR family transcriptional regulator [Burkholderia gladioli]MDN7741391.1 LysR family transcriptional regulator [Burkholderia gladioli]WAG21123.1 LysR family transcriptional regulator [Burkholderia gladioli]
MDNLRSLDLNLLRTLNVLLEEHNVSRAAERLNLSQPSVSVHLSKLRRVFKDPLLLPGPRGMRPTARADSLRESLSVALAALNEVMSPLQPFDPYTAALTWKIAATDYSETTVLLPTLPRLREYAPNTRVSVTQIAPRLIARQCEIGEVDLAFHTADEAPAGLRRKTLFQEKYVLVGRPDHPRLKRKVTVSQFCKLDHVIVSPDGGGFVGVTDMTLAQLGLKRRVVLSVPHFTFVQDVLSRTDLVAMLPSRLLKGESKLRSVAPPVEVPGYEMVMLWHERSHRDLSHQWLRELIGSSIKGDD